MVKSDKNDKKGSLDTFTTTIKYHGTDCNIDNDDENENEENTLKYMPNEKTPLLDTI